MLYWLARNDPGRLSRRGIRHAAFETINGIRATPPNDAFAQTLANEAHRMGQRRLFSYPFCPFAPTAPPPNFPFFVTLALFGA